MILQNLILTNFKNYASESLQLSDSVNCFVGDNGMGKTNLLDAIYYLCMTKSHFGINDRNIVQHQMDFFRLEGHFNRLGKSEKIVAKVIPAKKKEIERNAVAYDKLSEHIGFLPIVMIAPDDTSLAREGSEVRRRFLDNTLAQQDAEYLKKLLQYNKVLKQRNAALKQFAESGHFDYALLNTYNQQMLNPAAVIFEKRSQFVELFQPVFERYYKMISSDKEQVSCLYNSHLQKEDFIKLLEQNIEKDRILQRTTQGPHKDDLVFKLDEKPLKKFASQGQLKSYIFALKLAQYAFLRKQKKLDPILLLDDLFDKLDSKRVQQLLQLLIDEEFGQVFISDTNIERIPKMLDELDISYHSFLVENGTASDRTPKK